MKITKELIYPIGGGKTESCHASTLVKLSDGRIMAAWFGGKHESADDVEIWYSIRSKESGHWEPQRCISEESHTACWNPVLFSHNGTTTLWFKRGKTIAHWQTFVRRFDEQSGTWSEEREAVPGDISGGRGPVKNKPALLSDGTLIAGASHESEDKTLWRAFADVSHDGGMTWERGEYIETSPYVKLIQPTIWESGTGVHMLLRSAGGFVYRSDSRDMGKTWSAAYPTSMPNNNSGIDLAALPDGTLALVCNPVGEDWGARSPISLFLSHDDGESWERAADLESGEGEYSYPAAISSEGKLHITFTYQRKSVMYCEVEL